MKNLKANTMTKIAAVFLSVFAIAAALASSFCIIYIADQGYYNPKVKGTFYNSSVCSSITRNYAESIYYEYLYLVQDESRSVEDNFRLNQLEEQFSKDNTNFFFTVTDEENNVVLSNYKEQSYGTKRTYEYLKEDIGYYDKSYVIDAYVKDPITAADDYYIPYQVSYRLYTMRYTMIIIDILSIFASIALFVFLMQSAGRRKDTEEIKMRVVDKIPLDLYAFAFFVIETSIFGILGEITYANNIYWTALAACAAAILSAIVLIAFCMSLAVRIKIGKWWKNTIAYGSLHWAYKALRFSGRSVGVLLSNIPLLWKTIVIFVSYIFINGILVIGLNSNIGGFFLMLGFLFNLAALTGLSLIMLKLNKLKAGGERIAAGDYSCKIDTKNMFWDLKTHAESLNNIRLGMSKAVCDQLKSERLKTELITNVSHDIKTPLTSIVNYVDLLKKEDIKNETALKYIDVLDRQSLRLKKLTEDLVEASKASTGNISVSSSRVDAIELLNQSIGEYTERFAEGKLEIVTHTSEDKAMILADGKILWRVFDNLLSNILKYSQPGTRVYLDVNIAENKVVITLKNISRYPLNISSNELFERFVRGDSSRTTEGSGLGLSIARSLVELQGGSLELSLDGDLFKVTIKFNSIN